MYIYAYHIRIYPGFELRANQQLTDFKQKNLNIDPALPYENASFDIVTCVVSIDYLINPIKVIFGRKKSKGYSLKERKKKVVYILLYV